MPFWSKRRPAETTPAPPPPPQPQYATEPERETLRAQHQLRPVTDEEEGTGWRKLPSGVYGFTFVPALEDFPFFSAAKYHTFEAHKLPDGDVVLVGYVSADTASQMQTRRDPIEIKLCPDSREDAPRLVALPLSRVIRIKENSAREDGSLTLQLEPARLVV